MRLFMVFAVVAFASARPDVSELTGYTYSGPAVHHRSSSPSQYDQQFAAGTLEVIPLNLAHVSTTVHKEGDGGFGKDSAEYSSNFRSSSQYSSGGNIGAQYYSPSANLGAQYYAPAAQQGVQYSSGNLVSQYLSGSLGGQYSSGNLGGQYSGAQYSSGAGLGTQYTSVPVLTSSSAFEQNSGFSSGQGISSGVSKDASFTYHQLINDVLSGKYTVGSYSPDAYAASSHKQKISINLQPNAAPVTYRHVYFAETPAEAPVRPRIHIEGAIQPRKHVKVVFIKTPDQGSIADQELTLPQLEEEKTKIYVLSKEHNHQPQIHIKAGNAGTASRPEIFFLKYRTEADALKAQQILRENAAKDSTSSGAVLTDTNSAGAGSGFVGEQSPGASSSNFNGGFVAGLSAVTSSRKSEQSGSSNAGFASGLYAGGAPSNTGYASGQYAGGLTSNTGFASGQYAGGSLSNTGYRSGQSTGGSSSNAGFASGQYAGGSLSNTGYGSGQSTGGSSSNAGFASGQYAGGSLSNTGYASGQSTGGSSSNAGFASGQYAGGSLSNTGYASGQSTGQSTGQSAGGSSSNIEFASVQYAGGSSSNTGYASGQSTGGAPSNAGFASGLSTGGSSGFESNSASSFQSSSGSDNASTSATVPLKDNSYTSSSRGSHGVTTLYGAPSVGESSSGGFVV